MLQVNGIHVGYGAIRALRGVSLEVKVGEVVALIGANGAGKSTLLRTISGILKPTSGAVRFEGRTLNGMAEDKIVRLGILQVQEGRGILTRMSVQENLEMGAYGRSDKAEIRRDMEMVFDKFPILRERRRQFGATLSGGEQQMLAIGRALMARPKLLMLDEPSLGLAPMLVREIFRIIADFKREKRTILLVEQNARKALQCADRGYVLETGAIALSGTGDAVLKSEAVQAAYLGGTNRRRQATAVLVAARLFLTQPCAATPRWPRHPACLTRGSPDAYSPLDAAQRVRPPATPGGDPRRGCCRLLAPHGSRRASHGGGARCRAGRVPTPGRNVPGAGHRHGRRLGPGHLRPGQRGDDRSARDPGRARGCFLRAIRCAPVALPHRRAPGRDHREGGRDGLWRRCERGFAHPGIGRAGGRGAVRRGASPRAGPALARLAGCRSAHRQELHRPGQ